MKCPVCGHSHDDKWNDKIRDFDDHDTEEFIELSLKGLYACPNCSVVIYEN